MRSEEIWVSEDLEGVVDEHSMLSATKTESQNPSTVMKLRLSVNGSLTEAFGEVLGMEISDLHVAIKIDLETSVVHSLLQTHLRNIRALDGFLVAPDGSETVIKQLQSNRLLSKMEFIYLGEHSSTCYLVFTP